MRYPRILVAMPTAEAKDYCVEDFITQIKTFTYPNYDIFVLDNSSKEDHVNTFRKRGIKCVHEPFKGNFKNQTGRAELARHQNILREYFLRGDYDYLFMLESDVFCGESIMENLVTYIESYNADAITVTYEIKKSSDNQGDVLCLTSTAESYGVRSEKMLTREHGYDIMGQGCLPLNHLMADVDAKITATGIGCTMFSRRAMEAVEFRVDPKASKMAFSDSFIFTDIREKGMKVLINSDLIAEHRK